MSRSIFSENKKKCHKFVTCYFCDKYTINYYQTKVYFADNIWVTFAFYPPNSVNLMWNSLPNGIFFIS